MSIMQTLFGTKPSSAPVVPVTNPNTPVAAVPGNPGNIPGVQTNPAMATNPTVPAASMETGNTNTSNTPPSGLDEFSGMWAVDPNAKPNVPEPMFNVKPEDLAAAAKRNDFSKVVTPEMLAAISGGGEAAVQATLQAMNAMAQKSFADSALATTKIVESALTKQQAKFEASLPGFIKNQNLSDNLRNSSPIFNHPAAAPILEVFRNQVAEKFPNATATEQQEMAMRYVKSFAEAANPSKPTAAQKANANQTDWSEFL